MAYNNQYGYGNQGGYQYQQGGYQNYPPPGTPQQQQQGYGAYGRPPMSQGGYPPQQNYGKYMIMYLLYEQMTKLTSRPSTWTTWLSTWC